jgi:hypothetical protein
MVGNSTSTTNEGYRFDAANRLLTRPANRSLLQNKCL